MHARSNFKARFTAFTNTNMILGLNRKITSDSPTVCLTLKYIARLTQNKLLEAGEYENILHFGTSGTL